MQVIPVLDLMQGRVVRGLGGRRSEYRPLESMLAADAQPRTVAHALAGLGFRPTYVADLDALEKGDANLFSALFTPENDSRPLCSWPIYEDLIRAGLDPWIDAGVTDAADAQALAQFRVDGRRIAAIVVGLESVRGPAALAEMCALVGPERLIFSLDLKSGVPLARHHAWKGLGPEQIATLALRVGVRRMIVLDLASVGMGQGAGTEPLCRALRSLDGDLQLIAGGGVRGMSDLRRLEQAGCDAALVASALHDGRLDPRPCAAMR